ncbi:MULTISPECIES: NUDIX hydrolase [unclassified Clostridium]|uniref:NUDIX hydrolase n=1 Tax=unclassified Clostridium TaxID=2614128 RepID=UPI00189A16E8|nr:MULTISPECIES: NUDIX hydrolase [unclassified Clostridium]MCR1952494.1 NUDIX hydrolase [Clostridium sp. DSM 100503]
MSWIEEIKSYVPYTKQEIADKEAILYAINNFNNLLTRENPLAHITSSGYIVNKDKTKVLMIYHNIYNSWSWTGGHADGDEDLLYVAIKEAKEETGVKNIKALDNKIFSLDVLPVPAHIKKGKEIASHLHLSVAYLLEADENDELFIKEDENSGVKWIPIDEVGVYSTELDMIKLYEKFNQKIKQFY